MYRLVATAESCLIYPVYRTSFIFVIFDGCIIVNQIVVLLAYCLFIRRIMSACGMH